jgi:hypothetical protein
MSKRKEMIDFLICSENGKRVPNSNRHVLEWLEECCDVEIKRQVKAVGLPSNDLETINAAANMAREFFGEFFEMSDYGKRVWLIDMCEKGFRKVAIHA